MATGCIITVAITGSVPNKKDNPASSNAALVRQVVALCAEHNRRPATVAETRRMLSL